jgi:hypothetical protein
MASLYRRGNIYWVKLGHPRGGEQVRFSLDTVDGALAALLARLAQARFDLARPEFEGIEMPGKILEFLGQTPETQVQVPQPSPEHVIISETPKEPIRTSISTVLAEYIAYIRAENAPRHADNKLAHLRGFFGPGLLGVEKGAILFRGESLEDVKVNDVRRYIEGLPIATKTRRHYRETFHHLCEFAMKCEFFIPTNFRYPNPMSALPSYLAKNSVIRYLSPQEKDGLYGLLAPHPSLEAAARLMIEAGLRRAEALWLPWSALPSAKTVDPAADLPRPAS